MSSIQLTDNRLLIVAAALTVILAGATALLAPPESPTSKGPSSYSAAAGGAKAAFVTLKQLGYDVVRSFEPMTAIAADPSRTVLVITGHLPASDLDVGAMQAFLSRGGTAIVVGTHGAHFVGAAGRTAEPILLGPVQRHRAVAASSLAEGAMDITMSPLRRTPDLPDSYLSIFASGTDALVATSRQGSSRVVWLAAPTPLTNLHIRDADNLQFLLNAVGAPGDSTILWDEHYHGFARSLWSYAVHTPLPWIGAQLGLIALAVVLTFSRRRGPVRPRYADLRTSPMEFIEMLRTMYEKAGATAAAVTSARNRVRRTIVSTCGVPPGASDEILARAAASRRPLEADQLRALLVSADTASRNGAIDEHTALELIAGLQEAAKRLTDTAGRTRPLTEGNVQHAR